MFGLIGFTVAVTIVRGSIFGGVYKSLNDISGSELNITWIWFWFYVEFTVCKYHATTSPSLQKQHVSRTVILKEKKYKAFIIACTVSFRSLFVNKQRQHQEVTPGQSPQAGQQWTSTEEKKRRWRNERLRRFHDSVLDTCRTLEGSWDSSEFAMLPGHTLPKPPSGRLSVDFSQGSHGGSPPTSSWERV